MQTLGIAGKITVKFKQGKNSVGRGTFYQNGTEPYIDYAGKPHPIALDMKNATEVIFTPDMGKEKSFTQWEFFYNGQWVGPRLTKLA